LNNVEAEDLIDPIVSHFDVVTDVEDKRTLAKVGFDDFSWSLKANGWVQIGLQQTTQHRLSSNSLSSSKVKLHGGTTQG